MDNTYEPVMSWVPWKPIGVEERPPLSARMFRDGLWVVPLLEPLEPGQMLICIRPYYQVYRFTYLRTRGFDVWEGMLAMYVGVAPDKEGSTHLRIRMLDPLSSLAASEIVSASISDKDLVHAYALNWGILESRETLSGRFG
jgi:hypothetical protein